jgi:hypothetical protein
MEAARARKLLCKLPASVSAAAKLAAELARHSEDEVVVTAFAILKNRSNHTGRRVVPPSWELEYDIENALRRGALDRESLEFTRTLQGPPPQRDEPPPRWLHPRFESGAASVW